ncbi:MAG: phenylalanine--tRNA ligase subunit beta [Caldilineaceae bacterium]
MVKGELTLRHLSGRKVSFDDAATLAPDDLEMRIELNDTNRPDLWSVEGIARQLRDHARGYGGDYPCFSAEIASDQECARSIEVDPRLATIRPHIGGFYATGHVMDENGLRAFIETQETLTRNYGRKRASVSIGLYRGDGLAFPLHYRAVARDAVHFVPLAPAGTVADSWAVAQPVTPAEILALHPTGREYALLLAEQPLVPMLTDAGDNVLALIPIINSADLGHVTPGTTALFVEASGSELDQVLLTLNILAANLCDRGWTIAPVQTIYPYDTARGRRVNAPHPLALTQRAVIDEFQRLLGEPASGDELQERLAAYGVKTQIIGNTLLATAPDYRQDYLHAVDVIEDYAISRGYTGFVPTLPTDFTVGKLAPMTEREDLIRDLLIGFGFEEAFCNILTSLEQLQRRMAIGGQDGGAQPFHGGTVVRIENVMNRNYAVLRDWIVPSLLEIEAHSLGALYPHRIFEVGEVAIHDPAANHGSRTESRAAGIIADDNASFDSAQTILYALLGYLGHEFVVRPWQHPSFIPGRVGLVSTPDQRPLGFLGELSPQVLANWGVRTPIAAFELSLNALCRPNAMA